MTSLDLLCGFRFVFQTEVRFLKDKLLRTQASMSTSETLDDRSYDDRVESMGRDIDELKWKLIQKDQQVGVTD